MSATRPLTRCRWAGGHERYSMRSSARRPRSAAMRFSLSRSVCRADAVKGHGPFPVRCRCYCDPSCRPPLLRFCRARASDGPSSDALAPSAPTATKPKTEHGGVLRLLGPVRARVPRNRRWRVGFPQAGPGGGGGGPAPPKLTKFRQKMPASHSEPGLAEKRERHGEYGAT
jgi:hypothetical protein